MSLKYKPTAHEHVKSKIDNEVLKLEGIDDNKRLELLRLEDSILQVISKACKNPNSLGIKDELWSDEAITENELLVIFSELSDRSEIDLKVSDLNFLLTANLGNDASTISYFFSYINYLFNDNVKSIEDKNGESFLYMKTVNDEYFRIDERFDEMSNDEYLDFLAENLDTREKLHIFFDIFLSYTNDSSDEENPLKKGGEGESGDYWQLPEETIRRVEQGKMLGDCDDYAFLAKEILRRQGKDAYVEMIPGHAICVWFEQNKDGRWNAYSIGTYGLDENGNRYGKFEDEEKKKGYETLEDARNAILKKYENPGKGLSSGIELDSVSGSVSILNITKRGEKEFIRDLPIELYKHSDLLDRVIRLNSSVDYREKIIEYEKMIINYPTFESFLRSKVVESIIKLAEEGRDSGILLKYLEKNKNTRGANTKIGHYFMRNHNVGNSIKYYKKAMDNGNLDSVSISILNDFFVKNGDRNSQIKMLTEYIKKNKEGFYAYDDLAIAYLKVGEQEKALKFCRDNIEKGLKLRAIVSFYLYKNGDEEGSKDNYFRHKKPKIDSAFNDALNYLSEKKLLGLSTDNDKLTDRNLYDFYKEMNSISSEILEENEYEKFMKESGILEKRNSLLFRIEASGGLLTRFDYKILFKLHDENGDKRKALVSFNKSIDEITGNQLKMTEIQEKIKWLATNTDFKGRDKGLQDSFIEMEEVLKVNGMFYYTYVSYEDFLRENNLKKEADRIKQIRMELKGD